MDNNYQLLLKELDRLAGLLTAASEEITNIADEMKDMSTAITEETSVKFEDLRACLARKTRVSKENTAAIHDLIRKYGAGKLSEVKENDYAALLKDAEGLPDA